jgi:hypothetical protein
MISGKAIFADEDVYAGYKKRRHADELVRDTLVPMGIPRTVIDVLSRALAFDPKKRLARVDELSAELMTAIEPSTEDVVRLPPPPRPPQYHQVQHEPMTPTTPVNMVTPPAGAPVARAQTNDPATPPMVPVSGAPTPPVIPTPHDPTPQTFHAAVAQAWMSSAPIAKGTTRRLPLADTPQQVDDRRMHFVMVPNGIADLVGLHGTKVRITLLPGANNQRVVHVKGLSCFVAHLGGRPSPAVQINQSSDLALVTPRAQEIGHLRVAQGTVDGTQMVFPIGKERVGVAMEDCTDPILFDFGPGSDAYFVYTQGRTVPKSGRRG